MSKLETVERLIGQISEWCEIQKKNDSEMEWHKSEIDRYKSENEVLDKLIRASIDKIGEIWHDGN